MRKRKRPKFNMTVTLVIDDETRRVKTLLKTFGEQVLTVEGRTSLSWINREVTLRYRGDRHYDVPMYVSGVDGDQVKLVSSFLMQSGTL